MKRTTLLLLVCTLVFASCDLAGLNDNSKDPTKVNPSTLFTGAQVSLGTFMHNPNVNTHDFMFMAQHWTMTTYTGETRYNIAGRNVPAEVWERFYQDVLSNLQAAGNIIAANDILQPAEKKNKLAIIEVLEVYSYWHLVTLFGNIPFTEALDASNTLPAYTPAEEVYMSIVDSLNTAIANLNPSAPGFSATSDLYYNGNVNGWLKFANSLKLRMGMMLADVNDTKARAMVESAVAAGVIQSNAENAVMPFQVTPPNTHPVWENVIQSGRDDYVPAKPFVRRMDERKDPRLAVFFTTVDGKYKGGIYGETNEYSQFSHFAAPLIEKGRNGVILGYSEVEFLLAEAAQRGYSVEGTAAEHYKEAIRADMEFWGISDADITAYLAQPKVAYNENNWKKSIGIQKWFALWGQWYQAWTVFRRLDYPKLKAPELAIVETVPVRYIYPVTEYRYNGKMVENAAQAIGGDKYTNKLFWDVN